jgi:uncharacterized protein
MAESIICDTSVWLYIGRIGQLELLRHLYDPVYATETVCAELDIGRISRLDTPDVRQLAWVHIVQPSQQEIAKLPTNRLGQGEQSVLAYAHFHAVSTAALDDRQARTLAHQLGLRVTGTIGIILRAKRAKLVTSIRPLLADLQQQGFHISEALLEYALQRAGEQQVD